MKYGNFGENYGNLKILLKTKDNKTRKQPGESLPTNK